MPPQKLMLSSICLSMTRWMVALTAPLQSCKMVGMLEDQRVKLPTHGSAKRGKGGNVLHNELQRKHRHRLRNGGTGQGKGGDMM